MVYGNPSSSPSAGLRRMPVLASHVGPATCRRADLLASFGGQAILLGWPLGYLNIFPNGFHKDPIY